MCGVFGLLSRTSVAGRMTAMERALRHRGRDGGARHLVEEGGIGLVRLALVGRGEEARVASARVGKRSVHAVMNGEIYEHRALRRELEGRGIAVEGETDAAVAAALVAADGVDVLFALRATFAAAFVILDDSGARRLVLARDLIGKRPLFYAHRQGELAFASEVKGLMAAGIVDGTPSARALARFLAHGLLDEDESLFAGVEVLPAGCVLELDLAARHAAARPRRITRLRGDGDGRGPDDVGHHPVHEREGYLEQIAAAFSSAVQLRLPDEVRAQLLFSGGADSSLVARAAPGVALACVRVAEHDESATALARARALGRPLAIVEGGAWSRARLRRALALLEVPDAASSWSMAPALLALGDALQAEGVRVALTGEGADEIFLGYPWHALAAGVEHGVVPAGFADGTPEGATLDAARGIALADALADRPRRAALDLWLSVGSNQRRTDALAREIAGVEVPLHRAASSARGSRGRQIDALSREMRALPVLHADRLLLSCGVEARMPFLDLALVQGALRAPDAWLEDSAGGKPLLYALGARTAPGLALPPKRGFRGVPRPGDDVVEALARARISEGTQALPLARLLVPGGDAPSERARLEVLWRAFLLEETLEVVAQAAAEGIS